MAREQVYLDRTLALSMDLIHEINGLRYIEFKGVYPVEEDTLAFLDFVKSYLMKKKGSILDMGTGTGIISLLASRNEWSVISVDREPRALLSLRRNHELNGTISRMFISDLFQGIPRSFHGKFDLITFNPPYIPDDGSSISRRDGLALFGGPSGLEITAAFLSTGVRFLSPVGRFLILVSSDWNLEAIIDDIDLRTVSQKDKEIQGERFKLVELAPIDK